MGCKVLWLNVALIPYLMICEHVRAQCTQPSFPSRNAILSDSYISTENFADGDTVTFGCGLGYIPVNPRASKSVTCKGNQWNSLELNCTRKSCGSLPDFDNGKYERTGNLFGDTVTPVCNKGYVLDGRQNNRVCRDQGWDGRDPYCEAVKCKAPPSIVNGQLEDEPLDSYDYLQAVSYRCNNGLSIIGNSVLYCSEDGTFKPDPPTCMDGCPKPEIPHATRIGGRNPPYKQGNFIDYKCNDGYTMNGTSHIVCRTTGWRPAPPKCIGPCGQPDFSGKNVTFTEEFHTQKVVFPHGSKVTLKCISGHEPVNSTVSNSITCEETNWTKLIFTCKAVKCKAPPAIVNGQLEKVPLDSYDYLQTVSYRCNDGLRLIGNSTLLCSEDRTFKPEPPTCLALPITTTTATIVTSKAQPKDNALPITTTTATIVTSKAQPKDNESSDSSSSPLVIGLIVGFLISAVVICGLVYAYMKHRSKHQYSKKVAIKAEEGEGELSLTHMG